MKSSIESTLYKPGNRKAGRQMMKVHFGKTRFFGGIKRLVDVMLSLVVLILVFPWLLPILAILITIESRGPVFFKQRRVGYLGRIFWCYKFRTMRVNAMADTHRARIKDSRITRVGKFLRDTCLDELPQFFNVLRGDMSLVGPRPHMLQDTREFSEVVDNYESRSLTRPGITGLSQVRGYRGPAESFQSIFRRYQLDMYYVRNANWRLDLKIIAQTGMMMLRAVVYKGKPVPVDSPMIRRADGSSAKQIA
jgi:putative colanic acid biosynthesis UDP-glucose lipid carrier transferase